MGLLQKLFARPETPPERARKLGRNEKCWCGSGEKYKRCHYGRDQQVFSRERAAACKSGG